MGDTGGPATHLPWALTTSPQHLPPALSAPVLGCLGPSHPARGHSRWPGQAPAWVSSVQMAALESRPPGAQSPRGRPSCPLCLRTLSSLQPQPGDPPLTQDLPEGPPLGPPRPRGRPSVLPWFPPAATLRIETPGARRPGTPVPGPQQVPGARLPRPQHAGPAPPGRCAAVPTWLSLEKGLRLPVDRTGSGAALSAPHPYVIVTLDLSQQPIGQGRVAGAVPTRVPYQV